jgi:NADP-dependent 3-hydroxy acid dehydrogenase YdfG
MKRAPVDFRGQWVLVTGASSGLGREMAKQLVQIQYRFLLPGKAAPADTLTTNSPIRQFDVTITGITK